MLTVDGLVKRFGGFTAVNNVSFRVEQGEILGLIGPNGSGKSTIFNMLSGTLVPTAGSILFDGAEISGVAPHRIINSGIGRTFQIPRPFHRLSMIALPERGRIGIFNRSYYEDVLVVRVHPEILASQRLPPGNRGNKFWNARFDDINAFERHLTRNGTIILKFFLHISKKEQKKRFLERLDREDKHWKFSFSDLKEREYWDDYQEAFEEALTHTSTEWAPWWVIPADHKWVTRTLVASIVARSIDGLGLKYPEVSDKDRRRFAAARRELSAGK